MTYANHKNNAGREQTLYSGNQTPRPGWVYTVGLAIWLGGGAIGVVAARQHIDEAGDVPRAAAKDADGDGLGPRIDEGRQLGVHLHKVLG